MIYYFNEFHFLTSSFRLPSDRFVWIGTDKIRDSWSANSKYLLKDPNWQAHMNLRYLQHVKSKVQMLRDLGTE